MRPLHLSTLRSALSGWLLAATLAALLPAGIGCSDGEMRRPPRRTSAPPAAVILSRASAKLESGDTAAARALIETALASGSARGGALGLLAVLQAHTGARDSALTTTKAALDADPRDPIAHNNLGALYALAGRRDLAALALSEAARLAPDFPEPHEGLAYVHQRTGRPDLARASLAHADALRAATPQASGERRALTIQGLPLWEEAARAVPPPPPPPASNAGEGADTDAGDTEDAGEPAPAASADQKRQPSAGVTVGADEEQQSTEPSAAGESATETEDTP